MLLRISLGIAILAGLGVLYFSHFAVAPKITTLTEERDSAQSAANTAQEAEKTAKQNEKKAKEELDLAKKDLNQKSADLETAVARLTEQQNRGNQLATDLTRITGERNEAQQQLALWTALGVTADQVRALRVQAAKTAEERDAFAAENKILARNVSQLQTRLDKYEGDSDKEVPLPVGLKGKILAVDAKYDFVVLDIGGNQGVLENGRMLVSREGKLIGAVRITRVEPNRSIANVIPEMKQASLMEGDLVLY